MVYVCYTGGTIGMQHSEQGYIPISGYLQQQLALMPEFHHAEMPYFKINEYQPLIDSADMTPADWLTIANDIKQNYDDYDGFVILHGTDTMAYTASALSFMLDNLSKPVILTGSQIPLAELRSDGRSNLLNAIYLASNYPVNEVTLFFDNKLYRGNRSTKVHADGLDAFASPNFPPLLEIGVHIKTVSRVPPHPSSQRLTVSAMQPQPISIFPLYPGISPQLIANCLQPPVKALILRTYGIGNAPQQEELLEVLKQATDRGVIIVNLTQCLTGRVDMQEYATGNALARAGVISGADMTLEATLAKLHYLFSQSLEVEEICCKMQQNLRGELT